MALLSAAATASRRARRRTASNTMLLAGLPPAVLCLAALCLALLCSSVSARMLLDTDDHAGRKLLVPERPEA